LTSSAPATTEKAKALGLADVERVLAGEVRAFEGIVRRWQSPLINMAWRYCRDRGRAEELAQEAFLRVWRGLPTWRSEGSFSTWLFAVAANVFRSELKRFPTGDVTLKRIAEIVEPSYAATQHGSLASALTADTVRRAVLALPQRYREPLVLFYFYEMDVTAAARTMGLAEGTLKARLARGRALLRRRFPHLENELAGQPSEQSQRIAAPGSKFIKVAQSPGKEA
jgi:RNA polymerase sigma-70 factor (ECF subfamily)